VRWALLDFDYLDLRFAGSFNPQRICPRIHLLIKFFDRF
jgi:hypothetical protein